MLYEVFVVLIDRIVGQMHVKIVDVLLGWLDIRLCSKSHEPILEKENTQGIDAIQKHIQPHIKFQPVHQEGIGDVLLCNAIFLIVHLIGIPHQEDAFALAQVLWLNDIGLS